MSRPVIMINLLSKQLRLAVIFLIICRIETSMALTLCATAVWITNASTVAGNPSAVAGSNSSSLTFPTDVYIDSTNTIYVSDAGNLRVQRILPNSTTGITVLDRSYGGPLTRFTDMVDMSIDSNGNIYILDRSNARVTKWMSGNLTGTLVAGGFGPGININQINLPSGMFIEPSTSVIWIADTNNHRIIKWTSPTTVVYVCGTFGSNGDQFRYPGGLFVDISDSNKLYVADTQNHRIQMFPAGVTSGITVAGMTNQYGNGLNQLWLPKTLLVDNNQNMYIVDQSNNRILKWKIGASSGVIIAGGATFGALPTQLYYPMSINFDSNGSLFVADTWNNRIQKFSVSCPAISNTSTTTVSPVTTTFSANSSCNITRWSSSAITIAGTLTSQYGGIPTSLNAPNDVFVDNNSTVYVLDSGNYRVLRFSPNATYITAAVSGSYGSMLNQFSNMTALQVDANRNIYILDSVNSRVTKWIPGAYIGILVAGGNGAGINSNQLYYPFGMFMGLNSSAIWIADTYNHRIVRWDSPSSSTVVCGSYGSNADQFNYPKGLFVDTSASNTLYVADTNNHRVQIWSPGASAGTTVAGQTGVCGAGLNQLCNPTAVIKDSNGYIYIADSLNHRIMRWLIGSGAGTIIAGSSTSGALSYQLYRPNSVRLDPSGALIVADTGNNRVQKFPVACGPATTTSTSTSSSTSSTTTRTSTAAIDSINNRFQRLLVFVFSCIVVFYQ